MVQSRSIIAAVCTVGVASFSAFAVPLPSASVPATTTVPELRAFALTGPPAPAPAPASTVLLTSSGPFPSAEDGGLNAPEIDILVDDKPLLDVTHRHLQPYGQENIELSEEEHHHHEKADVEQQSRQHFYGGNEELEVELEEYQGGHGPDEGLDASKIDIEKHPLYRSNRYNSDLNPLFALLVRDSKPKAAEREDVAVSFMPKSANDPLPPHLLPRREEEEVRSREQSLSPIPEVPEEEKAAEEEAKKTAGTGTMTAPAMATGTVLATTVTAPSSKPTGSYPYLLQAELSAPDSQKRGRIPRRLLRS
ncbi:hypothetical protein F5878DRAFT_284941 [Lentinula raphanica]|uniref:Uncharacterized protein n=1 Tax=Lentinula raphanica TaxID=153919 RepID=A0AA38P4A0_9AGAR|nr:hypothetical protein F5878DRAFT_284941 [Lentinula raphanica]